MLTLLPVGTDSVPRLVKPRGGRKTGDLPVGTLVVPVGGTHGRCQDEGRGTDPVGGRGTLVPP